MKNDVPLIALSIVSTTIAVGALAYLGYAENKADKKVFKLRDGWYDTLVSFGVIEEDVKHLDDALEKLAAKVETINVEGQALHKDTRGISEVRNLIASVKKNADKLREEAISGYRNSVDLYYEKESARDYE